MPKITYLPENITVEVEPGQNVLEAALANGIHLDHACGGFCACSSCHIHVEAGMEHTSEQEDPEADQVEMAQGISLKSRLACQTKVYGDIIVRLPPQKGLG
ncbi:2Fe-2S iron-sulfur cluster binding domain-containing protein [bacterium]|nr:2Fe-2S iron-sulfur cluster binding domain-containing protein [bacterium]